MAVGWKLANREVFCWSLFRFWIALCGCAFVLFTSLAKEEMDGPLVECLQVKWPAGVALRSAGGEEVLRRGILDVSGGRFSLVLFLFDLAFSTNCMKIMHQVR